MSYHTLLLSFLQDKNEIVVSLDKIQPHIAEIFHALCSTSFNDKSIADKEDIYRIDYVLNYLHDLLNIGVWCEVGEIKRQAFTAASFVKSVIILKESSDLKAALKCVDHGFLLGLPLRLSPNLLSDCAKLFTELLWQKKNRCVRSISESNEPRKKNKSVGEYDGLTGKVVDVIEVPSLEEFYTNYFLPEIPVVIQGCMNHWPACKKWLDIDYLLRVAGERTVPVEIGSSYSDDNFSQKLMTLQEFIEIYYLKSTSKIGYLAQHDLLSQIPELKEDIRIPEYCCTSRDFENDCTFEPEINAWFGPAGTVSSLHYDPKDNFLCQVFGTKQVILFSPQDSKFLYPYDKKMLSNTAQVDPINPDLNNFPLFSEAAMLKCLLGPAEMLYIPPKWWHHVTAVQRSFSVNFWWQ